MEDQLSFEVYPHQVSGKEPKLFSKDKTRILKGFNQNEHDFYIQVNDEAHPSQVSVLKTYIPAFYGKLELKHTPSLSVQYKEGDKEEWLTHLAGRYKFRNESNEFIMLENLTYGYKRPQIFDIKIGGRNVEGKTHKITKAVEQFSLKLNGCQITDSNGKTILLTKYYLNLVNQMSKMKQYMAFYLSDKGAIQMEALNIFIKDLEQLSSTFSKIKGYRFISSSICFFYDGNQPKKAAVKYIDFGRATKEEDSEYSDEQTLNGMRNVLQILTGVREERKQLQGRLESVRKRIDDSQAAVIPQQKKKKYDMQSDE